MKKALALGLSLICFYQPLLADLAQARLLSRHPRHSRMPLAGIQESVKSRSPIKTFGDDRFQVPLQYGSVRKTINSNSSLPPIFYIQDVHLNAEAQNNIRLTLKELLKNESVSVVALEGAFGPVDLQPFYSFPYPEALAQAADQLLEENRLSGPTHALITHHPSGVRVLGVDDRRHYRANVAAYKKSLARQKDLLDQLESESAVLRKKKQGAFNEQLVELDAAVSSYEAEKTGLVPTLRRLKQLADIHFTTPALETFLEAVDLEMSLDTSRVEHERTQVLSQLVKKLNQDDAGRLTTLSLALRLGDITPAAFYASFQDFCRKTNVDLRAYPAMDSYTRYLLLSDQIKADDVLASFTSLRDAAAQRLLRTPEEKNLWNQSRQLSLKMKLVRFALTPDEWNAYKRGLSSQLSTFESFYRHAEARDRTIAKNLLGSVGDGDAVVLVTGGFHAAGLEKILARTGRPIISFVPRLTRIDSENGSSYLSFFAQEKTPLEKLVEGDRLFTSPPQFESDQRAAIGLTALGIVAQAGTFLTSRAGGILKGTGLKLIWAFGILQQGCLIIHRSTGLALVTFRKNRDRIFNDRAVILGVPWPVLRRVVMFAGVALSGGALATTEFNYEWWRAGPEPDQRLQNPTIFDEADPVEYEAFERLQGEVRRLRAQKVLSVWDIDQLKKENQRIYLIKSFDGHLAGYFILKQDDNEYGMVEFGISPLFDGEKTFQLMVKTFKEWGRRLHLARFYIWIYEREKKWMATPELAGFRWEEGRTPEKGQRNRVIWTDSLTLRSRFFHFLLFLEDLKWMTGDDWQKLGMAGRLPQLDSFLKWPLEEFEQHLTVVRKVLERGARQGKLEELLHEEDDTQQAFHAYVRTLGLQEALEVSPFEPTSSEEGNLLDQDSPGGMDSSDILSVRPADSDDINDIRRLSKGIILSSPIQPAPVGEIQESIENNRGEYFVIQNYRGQFIGYYRVLQKPTHLEVSEFLLINSASTEAGVQVMSDAIKELAEDLQYPSRKLVSQGTHLRYIHQLREHGWLTFPKPGGSKFNYLVINDPAISRAVFINLLLFLKELAWIDRNDIISMGFKDGRISLGAIKDWNGVQLFNLELAVARVIVEAIRKGGMETLLEYSQLGDQALLRFAGKLNILGPVQQAITEWKQRHGGTAPLVINRYFLAAYLLPGFITAATLVAWGATPWHTALAIYLLSILIAAVTHEAWHLIGAWIVWPIERYVFPAPYVMNKPKFLWPWKNGWTAIGIETSNFYSPFELLVHSAFLSGGVLIYFLLASDLTAPLKIIGTVAIASLNAASLIPAKFLKGDYYTDGDILWLALWDIDLPYLFGLHVRAPLSRVFLAFLWWQDLVTGPRNFQRLAYANPNNLFRYIRRIPDDRITRAEIQKHAPENLRRDLWARANRIPHVVEYHSVLSYLTAMGLRPQPRKAALIWETFYLGLFSFLYQWTGPGVKLSWPLLGVLGLFILVTVGFFTLAFHNWVFDGNTLQYHPSSLIDKFIVFGAGISFSAPYVLWMFGGMPYGWWEAWFTSAILHLFYNKVLAPYLGWPLASGTLPSSSAPTQTILLEDEDFVPMGEIIGRINKIHYEILGREAFNADTNGFVTNASHDSMTALLNAREFYEHLRDLDQLGRLPDVIEVHEYGIGNGRFAAEFLSQIKNWDHKNNTFYYDRILYVLGDQSAHMLEDARQFPLLAVHDQAGRLKFMELDASQPLPFPDNSVHLIRLHELYDDLPGVRVIEKKDGRYFEVKGRLVINTENKIQTKTSQIITAAEFKTHYWNKGLDALKQLDPNFVGALDWQEERVPLDIEQDPDGFWIQEYTTGLKNARFPLNHGAAANLKECLRILDSGRGGALHVFDYGTNGLHRMVDPADNVDEVIRRPQHHQPTVDVNFHYLINQGRKTSPSVQVRLERHRDYLKRRSGHEMFRLSPFREAMRDDTKRDTLVGMDLLTPSMFLNEELAAAIEAELKPLQDAWPSLGSQQQMTEWDYFILNSNRLLPPGQVEAFPLMRHLVDQTSGLPHVRFNNAFRAFVVEQLKNLTRFQTIWYSLQALESGFLKAGFSTEWVAGLKDRIRDVAHKRGTYDTFHLVLQYPAPRPKIASPPPTGGRWPILKPFYRNVEINTRRWIEKRWMPPLRSALDLPARNKVERTAFFAGRMAGQVLAPVAIESGPLVLVLTVVEAFGYFSNAAHIISVYIFLIGVSAWLLFHGSSAFRSKDPFLIAAAQLILLHGALFFVPPVYWIAAYPIIILFPHLMVDMLTISEQESQYASMLHDIRTLPDNERRMREYWIRQLDQYPPTEVKDGLLTGLSDPMEDGRRAAADSIGHGIETIGLDRLLKELRLPHVPESNDPRMDLQTVADPIEYKSVIARENARIAAIWTLRLILESEPRGPKRQARKNMIRKAIEDDIRKNGLGMKKRVEQILEEDWMHPLGTKKPLSLYEALLLADAWPEVLARKMEANYQDRRDHSRLEISHLIKRKGFARDSVHTLLGELYTQHDPNELFDVLYQPPLIPELANAIEIKSRWRLIGIQYGDIAINTKIVQRLPDWAQRLLLRHQKNRLWYQLVVRRQIQARESWSSSGFLGDILEFVLVVLADPFVEAPDVTMAMIRESERLLKPLLKPVATRLAKAEQISQRSGMEAFIKMENEHEVGSFKARVAAQVLRWFAMMTPAERAAIEEIVVESTGNQGMAVTWAVQKIKEMYPECHQLQTVVYAGRGAARNKIAALRKAGAIVRQTRVQFGQIVPLKDYGDAHDEVVAYKERKGPKVLHVQHGSWWVMGGYATMATEIMRQLPLRREDDGPILVLVPVGSGGLYTGLWHAFRSYSRRHYIEQVWKAIQKRSLRDLINARPQKFRIVPIETTKVKPAFITVLAGRNVGDILPMVAVEDGIAVKRVEPIPEKQNQVNTRKGEPVVLVDREQMQLGLELTRQDSGTEKLEPSSGLPAAALLTYLPAFQNAYRTAVLIATGGNIDEEEGEDLVFQLPHEQNSAGVSVYGSFPWPAVLNAVPWGQAGTVELWEKILEAASRNGHKLMALRGHVDQLFKELEHFQIPFLPPLSLIKDILNAAFQVRPLLNRLEREFPRDGLLSAGAELMDAFPDFKLKNIFLLRTPRRPTGREHQDPSFDEAVTFGRNEADELEVFLHIRTLNHWNTGGNALNGEDYTVYAVRMAVIHELLESRGIPHEELVQAGFVLDHPLTNNMTGTQLIDYALGFISSKENGDPSAEQLEDARNTIRTAAAWLMRARAFRSSEEALALLESLQIPVESQGVQHLDQPGNNKEKRYAPPWLMPLAADLKEILVLDIDARIKGQLLMSKFIFAHLWRVKPAEVVVGARRIQEALHQSEPAYAHFVLSPIITTEMIQNIRVALAALDNAEPGHAEKGVIVTAFNEAALARFLTILTENGLMDLTEHPRLILRVASSDDELGGSLSLPAAIINAGRQNRQRFPYLFQSRFNPSFWEKATILHIVENSSRLTSDLTPSLLSQLGSSAADIINRRLFLYGLLEQWLVPLRREDLGTHQLEILKKSLTNA